MAASKETIYIEADDEITTVIEKVVTAKNAIIALVLPKRATVFQSVVNLKLLKKAATETKRKVVLISSESSIESIAAVAGLHVAKSLTSKPVIPKRAINAAVATVAASELDSSSSATPSLTSAQSPVPEKVPLAKREASEDDIVADTIDKDKDTLEIDNTEQTPVPVEEVVAMPEAKKPKFKIPDFGSFRLRMTLIALAVVLLGLGWFVGFVVMPKATITINADTTNTQVSFPFTADTAVKELNIEEGMLPAVKEELTKENKATVEATGKKDIGEKATGTVTFSMKDCSVVEVTVPSGTAISANGLSYITTEDATMQSVKFGNSCRNEDFKQFSTDTVDVVAQQAGENYNRSAGGYSVAISTVTAYGSDMVGGTSQIVQIVSAEDIQKAKDQLKGTATADATAELKEKINSQGRFPIAETFTETEPAIRSSKEVNAEASEVTVTQTVTYSMLGVTTNELAQLLEEKIQDSFNDDQARNIRNNGLETARYLVTNKASNDKQTITLETIATIGADFDQEAIKKEAAGKKRGDIEKLLESREGVRSVSVEYSPFWITTTTKKPEKINIVINEVQN